MRTLVTLLLLAGALYAAACGAVLLLQRSMIYYPQPAAGRPPERLRLDVDGARVLVSVQPRPGGRAVLYFGGNAEDVSLSLPELAAAFPQRADAQADRLAVPRIDGREARRNVTQTQLILDAPVSHQPEPPQQGAGGQ